MNVTLYKGHKNSIGSWNISVGVSEDGTEFGEIVISNCTKLGGKPVVHKEFIEKGKNIGKANETTPCQQAILEAKSRVRKQLDKGYVDDLDKIPEYPCNALGHPMPVLAKPIAKVKKLDFTHAWIQPKLDGHRCPTVKTESGILMYSRQGKPITTLPHIEEELMDTLELGERLDGELYNHNFTLQEISSGVKKSSELSKEIQYHVYDAIDPNVTYQERFLDRFYSEDTSGFLQAVETHEVSNSEEAWEWFHKFRAQGYEGAILRLGNQGYEIGRRSSNLLKLKSFEDAEFKVVGVNKGTPRNVNGKEFKVGILVCTTEKGKLFTVTAPGDAAAKQVVAEYPNDFIGQPLTVQFANLTPDGIPFHGVAVRFREDV